VGAWGFIIHDYTGECVLVGAGNEGRIHDALMAETIACMKALELAKATRDISHCA